MVLNFRSIGLISVSDEVPVTAFALELIHAISATTSSFLLTSDYVKKILGQDAFDPSREEELQDWLMTQECKNRITFYQCDQTLTTWTQTCVKHADNILIIALADTEPCVGRVERQLDHMAVRTQMELVLLHSHDAAHPSNTIQWLNMRYWCSNYHHIRCPANRVLNMNVTESMSEATLRRIYADIMTSSPPDIHTDMSRLGRFLTGNTVGLVLGGGGARGAAHVGMMKAIRESNIPIDMIGGVSIGAFMSALWAQELDIEQMRLKSRKWSFTIKSLWRQILDLTYPVTAMFTGAAFNRTIRDIFGDRQIEDLWIPYFTVTTDITSSKPRIHRFGNLWRYVRASMSLSGYLPPLCDPVDGHLLLDGGYVNNLPGDVMREVMGAKAVIAVDVGSLDETDTTNYGDELSGWWLLFNRWNPFGQKIRVPNLPEIQSRLAYISCVRQLEEVKRSDYCTYIRPPIDRFKTLQFASFDDIMEIGYKHGKDFLTAMMLSKGKQSLHMFLQRRHPIDSDDLGLQSKHQYHGVHAVAAAKYLAVESGLGNQLSGSTSNMDMLANNRSQGSQPHLYQHHRHHYNHSSSPVKTASTLKTLYSSDATDFSEDDDIHDMDYYYHSEPEINGNQTDTDNEPANPRSDFLRHRKILTFL